MRTISEYLASLIVSWEVCTSSGSSCWLQVAVTSEAIEVHLQLVDHPPPEQELEPLLGEVTWTKPEPTEQIRATTSFPKLRFTANICKLQRSLITWHLPSFAGAF